MSVGTRPPPWLHRSSQHVGDFTNPEAGDKKFTSFFTEPVERLNADIVLAVISDLRGVGPVGAAAGERA